MLILLYFLIGALAGRIRGAGQIDFGGKVGVVKIPTEIARFGVWGIPVGILVGVYSHNLIYALVAQILAGAGASFGYYAQFGIAQPENQNWKNYAILSIMGMIRFIPLLIAAIFVHHGDQIILAVLAGILFVPAYKFGITMQRFKLPLLKFYTEWGEFFFWGSIYAALGIGLRFF